FVAFLMDETTNRNRRSTLYVRDRVQHTTQGFSVELGSNPTISADGTFVTYTDNGVVIRDLATGKVELASVSAGGAPANRSSYTGAGPISADGRYVVYLSLATNLAAGDANDTFDVFVRDRAAGTTELVSVAAPPPRAPLDAGGVVVQPKRPVPGAAF